MKRIRLRNLNLVAWRLRFASLTRRENMRHRLPLASLLAAILCLGSVGCTKQPRTHPDLSLPTLAQLSAANTTRISFEEKNGDILVTMTDRHGDSHLHRLDLGGVSKSEALSLLRQKQSELSAGK